MIFVEIMTIHRFEASGFTFRWRVLVLFHVLSRDVHGQGFDAWFLRSGFGTRESIVPPSIMSYERIGFRSANSCDTTYTGNLKSLNRKTKKSIMFEVEHEPQAELVLLMLLLLIYYGYDYFYHYCSF